MTSFRTFLTFFVVFLASHLSVALPYQQNIEISTISAAPALLPEAPQSYPPSISPDISPLFPTPGGKALTPSESPIPTIPSSPSPPNPDAIASLGPDAMAHPPAWSMPVSTSESHNKLPPLNSVGMLAILAMFLLWISGV